MTKEVVLIPSNEGIVGDTPGFSSLELNLTKRDASIFFPGFKQYLGKCFYNNCLHLKEKECKIKEAVEKNIILKESYDNYKALEELQERRKNMERKKYIAPSLLAANFTNLDSELNKLKDANIKYLHYDVMDSHLVQIFLLAPLF